MALLIVSMNLSLDGYIEAQREDDGSWLSIDEEVHVAFNHLAADASAFLYGRKPVSIVRAFHFASFPKKLSAPSSKRRSRTTAAKWPPPRARSPSNADGEGE